MAQDNLKDIENLISHTEAIDDCYYEVFRLLQDELQQAVDEHPDSVPTERVLQILSVTDMFYNKVYGKKENTDRQPAA